eukprot:NODE_481_length_6950_cov_0.533353.p5 type:complete len:248 gc:universal NODE_481_length_6950_cov_0.533353:5594-4851(-)
MDIFGYFMALSIHLHMNPFHPTNLPNTSKSLKDVKSAFEKTKTIQIGEKKMTVLWNLSKTACRLKEYSLCKEILESLVFLSRENNIKFQCEVIINRLQFLIQKKDIGLTINLFRECQKMNDPYLLVIAKELRLKRLQSYFYYFENDLPSCIQALIQVAELGIVLSICKNVDLLEFTEGDLCILSLICMHLEDYNAVQIYYDKLKIKTNLHLIKKLSQNLKFKYFDRKSFNRVKLIFFQPLKSMYAEI